MTAKNIRHLIEYAALRLIIFFVNILPVKAALRIGDVLGWILFTVVRYRRRVTLANLKRTFGERFGEVELIRIGRRSYINFARSLIEFALFPRFAKRDLSKKIKIVGGDPLVEHFKTGRGAVLFSGHFGSWELVGAYLAQIGLPIDFLVGIQSNRRVNNLMNKHRSLFGIGLIEIGVAARGVFGALKRGRGVAMLADQDAGGDGVIIDFLGRPASTAKGPAAFALKTGCPVFVGNFVRIGLDEHVLYMEGPLTIEPTGAKEEDIRRLTQVCNDILGDYIRRFPDQYLWSHRRWKSTCPEDYEFSERKRKQES